MVPASAAAGALLFIYNLYFTSQRGPEVAGSDTMGYGSLGNAGGASGRDEPRVGQGQ